MYDIEGQTFRKVFSLAAGGLRDQSAAAARLPPAVLRGAVARRLVVVFGLVGRRLADRVRPGADRPCHCRCHSRRASPCCSLLGAGSGSVARRRIAVRHGRRRLADSRFDVHVPARAVPAAVRRGRSTAASGGRWRTSSCCRTWRFRCSRWSTTRRSVARTTTTDDTAIYEQGLLWIARGLVHLVLYRVVYHNLLVDPVDVATLGDLAQFMLGTFLLYLRVSGQFHLIVGMLHLFGFRLPETHKLYYLAHSFTELWRRINIYWTDFMMKMVFYPAYFKVKRLGPPRRTWCARRLAVFFVTWLLHSYQWFWLRGGFPMTRPDIALLGSPRHARRDRGAAGARGRPRSRKRSVAGTGVSGLQAATTFFVFCFLWSLWSTESVSQWMWMLGAATEIDAKGVVLVAATFGLLAVLGGRDWDARIATRPASQEALLRPDVRTIVAAGRAVAGSRSRAASRTPRRSWRVLDSLHTTGLNARDAAAPASRLLRAARRPRPGQRAGARRRRRQTRATGRNSTRIGMLRERDDLLDARSRSLAQRRSGTGSASAPIAGACATRITRSRSRRARCASRCLVRRTSWATASPTARLSKRWSKSDLNREFRSGTGPRYEILNFGVDGYTLPQQLAILEDRVCVSRPTSSSSRTITKAG